MKDYLPSIIKKLRERKHKDTTLEEVYKRGYKYISQILYPIDRWKMGFYYEILYWGIRKAKENKDWTFMAEFYKDLSIMNRAEEKNKFAAKYINLSLNLSKKYGLKLCEANCYGNLAISEFKRSNYLKAIFYHKKAIALHRELKDKKRELANIYLVGINYLMLKDFKNALKYLDKTASLSKKICNRGARADGFYGKGVYFQSISKFNEGIISTYKAIPGFIHTKNFFKVIQCYHLLSHLYHLKGKDERSKEFSRKLNIIEKEYYKK